MESIWTDYLIQNHETKKVFNLFTQLGEEVINDHIAFRTFNDPRVCIDVLAKPFVAAGYVSKGEYHFEAKRLYAKHYELEGDAHAPRIFISELKLEEMSSFLRETVMDILNQASEEDLGHHLLVNKGRIWAKPSFKVYEKLRMESEYASWLYVYGFRANHFTVSINALKNYPSIEAVNQLLKDKGFLLNSSGGEIKGSPEELLEQSSTLAGNLAIEFEEAVYDIPSCFYEFARRYKDNNGQLYGGFIAKSADKIFESTDFYQK